VAKSSYGIIVTLAITQIATKEKKKTHWYQMHYAIYARKFLVKNFRNEKMFQTCENLL